MDRHALLSRLLGGDDKLPQRLPDPDTLQHFGQAPVETSKPKVVDLFGNMHTQVENMSIDELPNFHEVLDAVQATQDANNASMSGSAAPKKSTTPHIPTPRQTNGDAETIIDEQFGKPSEAGQTFCPFAAITKFPYRFLNNAELLQPVASAYFDREQIYEREWDFYYIDGRHTSTGKAITLVKKEQVELLLEEMRVAFPTLKWTFEPYHEEIGLLIKFDDADAELRPRFLGHCNTRRQYDDHVNHTYQHPTPEGAADKDGVDTFKGKVMLAFDIGKSNWKGDKRAKDKMKPAGTAQQPPTYRQDPNDKQLPKAKQYLGLGTSPDDTVSKSLVPDVIFIAIDVEAWEQNHSYITEVGIATLDTRDLKAVDAGINGTKWHDYIRGRHFRIREFMDPSYTNHKYMHGCPNAFRYGKSEVVSKKDIASVLTSCFHHPFSSGKTDFDKDEVRQVVLLGHDTKTDIDYCHQMGFSVKNRGNLCDVMDTAAMYRHYSKEVNPRKLGSVLEAFDLEGWSLHNAGNDAVYTVQAMLAICVADAGGNEQAKRVQESIAKMAVTFGPPKPPHMAAASSSDASGSDDGVKLPKSGGTGPPTSGFFTSGGAPLDV